VEEATASSQTLSEQAAELQQLVGKFRIIETASSAPSLTSVVQNVRRDDIRHRATGTDGKARAKFGAGQRPPQLKLVKPSSSEVMPEF